MGRVKWRIGTEEGEGGQTHWLAAKEKSGEKKKREENTRKPDS